MTAWAKLSIDTVYNTCVPHYSMAGDKSPLSLLDTLHGNSHMLRLAHEHSTGFQLHSHLPGVLLINLLVAANASPYSL